MITRKKPFGFNVCGFISAHFGISVAARNTIQVLCGQHLPVSVIDIPLTSNRSGKVNTFSHLHSSPDNLFPYAITLFHLNADMLPSVKQRYSPSLSGHLDACIPFWELDRIPQSWIAVFNTCDVILAPTRFIQRAIESSACNTPVLHYPQTVYLPNTVTANRSRWNLPSDAVLFVFSFDMLSDFMRKNPIGALTAFDRAFGNRRDVCFVLKVYMSQKTHRFLQIVESIKKFAASRDNIRIIDQEMSYEETLSLYASADVYVSLHRAEGLGLSLMEAMFLGKPVITTAWSGNMDYTTPDNSCPVSYSLVPAESPFTPMYNEQSLGFQPMWAEPDIDEAAHWMKELAENESMRLTIGHNAQKSMMMIQENVGKGEPFAYFESLYHDTYDTTASHADTIT